ncbi:uncharacterized protein LOC134541368 [Bacillus rossius redtenbacheri]|uniref:uncharacterized protein LOC134541368 n=1 Tax=Bacillus rossius redtenbacheri TaxID=93214 RepID=UPI002FDF08B3
MSARAVLLLRLMEDVARYLDLSGQLPALEQAGRAHQGAPAECRPVLRFSVRVDLLRLIHLSGHCGRLLLAEPLVARDVIQKVVHLSLEALVPHLVLGRDQVQITVRLETFPSTSLLTRGPQLTGLVLMKGVLVARTTTVKYICSSVYRCPTPGCGNRAGTRRAGPTLLQGARCRHCGECLEELPRGRDTGDQVQGLLLAPEALRGRPARPLPPVLVCFRDIHVKPGHY